MAMDGIMVEPTSNDTPKDFTVGFSSEQEDTQTRHHI